ncbi:MAG: L-threonylcarbamoyladenylate synthase [Verrucomicrobiota bacterium]
MQAERSTHRIAQVLPAHTPDLFRSAVRQAADRLNAGDVVALPTETVYGLAANALDAEAVAGIYRAKGRPAHNPIIVHVASLDMARACVTAWPEAAARLAAAFWPGPLTLVLSRSEKVPGIVTAGGPTVGIRWPSHPLIQAVIRKCNFPLAAPSANLSNRISPTSAEHVLEQLGDRIPLIVDGGASAVGIESTVLDLTVDPPRVLRPGMIHEPALAAVLGNLRHVELGERATCNLQPATLRSPGLLAKHYAPRARLVILRWRNDADLERLAEGLRLAPGDTHVLAHHRIPGAGRWREVSVIPHDPEAFARALYAELHRCDAAGAQNIVVESVPDGPEWAGLADRLRRAASPGAGD